ncbi:hypothetical protein [Georgenia sp. AZ-5]|uniref:hypothetical protein n=1 Tax=Georgenia sp. AZ-5 TaxID=3367526 RepID=UPI0037542BE8
MTAAGDVLNQVVPVLVRLARRPGGLLLTAAALGVGVLALLGAVYTLAGDGGSWFPLVLAGVLAVPVLVLAVRRERLQARTQGLALRPTVVGTRDVVVAGAAPNPVQEELEAINGALVESSIRTARFLPRVEAAQRAAVRAAGGTVNAPYLKDDLRVTLVALVGTVAAVPVSAVASVVTAVLLLVG